MTWNLVVAEDSSGDDDFAPSFYSAPKEFQTPKGMDNAVLSVSEGTGEFIGIKGPITRDPTFPIRCTVQFYKVTDEEDVPEKEFEDMAANITKLYTTAIAMGSLVMQVSNRKTEWGDNKEEVDPELGDIFGD